MRLALYILKQKAVVQEGNCNVQSSKVLVYRVVCPGPGAGDFDHGDLPHWRAAVSHCFFADRMRRRLPAPVGMKGDVPCYEDRRCEIAKVFVRRTEKNFPYRVNKAPLWDIGLNETDAAAPCRRCALPGLARCAREMAAAFCTDSDMDRRGGQLWN